MGLISFTAQYTRWHYGKALPELFSIWKNIAWFTYHYFSLGLLLSTFFQPFRRFHAAYDIRGLELGQLAKSFLLNTIMRLAGMIFRSVILTVGTIVELLLFLSLPALLTVWLFLPFLTLGFFLMGFILIIP